MDEKVLLEAVVLAGEIMLVSGAEVYRVENTMKYMLGKSSCETAEAVVLATGIFVTLDDPNQELLTMAKRIPARSTNVNRVCRVNDISRRFCGGEISVETAYKELKEVEKEVLYTPFMKALGFIGVSASFTFIFGGKPLDLLACTLVGICLALADFLVKKIRLNDFCNNAFCSFVVAVCAMAIEKFILKNASSDVMIMSAIMTLVPGVTFTTAIRDTLNGDYAAGSARMLEAVVVALAVAAGVGSGMMFFRMLQGGLL